MFQNRFDELYLTICKQVGGIQGLLKSFFDFMIRKTDFFYECDPGDKMGFPPGYNEKLVTFFLFSFLESFNSSNNNITKGFLKSHSNNSTKNFKHISKNNNKRKEFQSKN